uniref:Omega-hydroxypalmitate O-feruloyl transferase n=1 Tax=Anthurium amnicola TaxID=1678845 RepID=A0A1D1XLU7_9ARAE
MVDGTSTTEFMNSWGETARGLPLSVPPFLDRTILRARVPPKIEYLHQELTEIEDVSDMASLYEEEYILRSFCFDSERLERVKVEATEGGVLGGGCTTFEALAGFVWRARTRALRMRPHQQTRLLCAVNVRRRLHPPLPVGFFGNGVVVAHRLCPAGELLEKPLSFAVGMVQEAVGAVTSGYVRSVLDYIEATRGEEPSFVASHMITSWSRLPFYAADFGWGEPLQYGPPAPVHRDLVMFLSRGKGCTSINVLMGLPSTAMVTFQELVTKI